MGGEKSLSVSSVWSRTGSPPHGRGKGTKVTRVWNSDRITPAWAGKSQQWPHMCGRSWDHPRMGGEKTRPAFRARSRIGSPPHGRGKVVDSVGFLAGQGITPAWAGKRSSTPPSSGGRRDHPRMGGEKLRDVHVPPSLPGSPPHGRGKELHLGNDDALEGITPAWAGKRLKRSHRSGIFISGPIPFHSVLHRPAGSGGSRAGRDGSPAGQPQNAGPA